MCPSVYTYAGSLVLDMRSIRDGVHRDFLRVNDLVTHCSSEVLHYAVLDRLLIAELEVGLFVVFPTIFPLPDRSPLQT